MSNSLYIPDETDELLARYASEIMDLGDEQPKKYTVVNHALKQGIANGGSPGFSDDAEELVDELHQDVVIDKQPGDGAVEQLAQKSTEEKLLELVDRAYHGKIRRLK